jgi:hypothetical protein
MEAGPLHPFGVPFPLVGGGERKPSLPLEGGRPA